MKWDILQKKCVDKKKLDGPINCLDLSRNNQLAVGMKNGMVHLYEASTLKPRLRILEYVNPLFPILDSWSRALVYGQNPELSSMLAGLGWATGIFFICTYIFLSREREFSVRL